MKFAAKMYKLYLIFFLGVSFFVTFSAGHVCHCEQTPTCPPNEEFIKCGSLCQETCLTKGENCTRVGLGGIKCEDRCYCKKGYVRGCTEESSCMKVEMCALIKCANPSTTTPKPLINCTRPHEHYECGSACQTECRTLGQTCPIVNIQCNHGCYCDEGYARACNENGPCIPISKCDKTRCPSTTTPKPPINCTRPHEHYECGSACQTECRTLGQKCPIINVACNHGCYCDEGYARACNENGPCIRISKCKKRRCPSTTTMKPPINCTRPYEHYECGSACQTECKTLGKRCPIENIQCNHGCYCDKGYARDENKRCIKVEECPNWYGSWSCD